MRNQKGGFGKKDTKRLATIALEYLDNHQSSSNIKFITTQGSTVADMHVREIYDLNDPVSYFYSSSSILNFFLKNIDNNDDLVMSCCLKRISNMQQVKSPNEMAKILKKSGEKDVTDFGKFQ